MTQEKGGVATLFRRFAARVWTRSAAASALLCTAMTLGGCDQDAQALITVDSEKEAIAIMVELDEQKIGPSSVKSTGSSREPAYEVRVPTSQVAQARRLLVSLDMPKERSPGLDTLVESQGMIPTRTDERARLMMAMAGELERTLETYDGVVDARVHVVLTEMDSLSKEPSAGARASVVIKYRAGSRVLEQFAKATTATNGQADATTAQQGVKKIVMNALSDVADDDITVAFTETVPRGSTGAEENGGTASDDRNVAANKDRMSFRSALPFYGAIAALSVLCVGLAAALWTERRRNGKVAS